MFICDPELFSDSVFEVIILNQYVLLRGAFFGLKLLTYLVDLYYFRIVYMRFLLIFYALLREEFFGLNLLRLFVTLNYFRIVSLRSLF